MEKIKFLLCLLSLLGLLLNNVYCHTVQICREVSGSSVTIYAATYHLENDFNSNGLNGLSGGVILNGKRYDFRNKIIDDGNGKPLNVDLSNYECSKQCDPFPSWDGTFFTYWQYVKINGLSDGTYTVTTTSDNAIEQPQCEFPDIEINGIIPTLSPTNIPTNYPTNPPKGYCVFTFLFLFL